MFPKGWIVGAVGLPARAVACAIAGLFASVSLVGADNPPGDVTLFRVFLTNGTAITSYGEYARVGDRVVFSVPIGGGAAAPALHLVNLPASLVDWAQTERYADAARYTHYVQTRGDADYAALNNEIAQVLSQITAAKEAGRRLELALAARRKLTEWPSTHFGYRGHDVAQMSAILDEVISELRAETGGTAFDLTFVATVNPPEMLPPAAPATEREMIEQALTAAKVADTPSERVSLLEAISAALAPTTSAAGADETWRATIRTTVTTELAAERKTDAAYAATAVEFTRAAARYARRADIAGVQRVLNNVARADQRLGNRRPDQIRALVQTIEAELEKAQRLRLALDYWELRLPSLRKYADVAADLLQAFDAARWKIEEIQRLAGPSDALLGRLVSTCEGLARSLRALSPPAELAAAHSLVLSAVELASTAGRLRREAIRSQNLETARDASSAAAGALMLMARARADIERQLQRPAGTKE